MELRGNVKRIGGNENSVEINKERKLTPIIPVIDVSPQKTTPEQAKNVLDSFVRGIQEFADWASSTRAGSGRYDDLYGSTPTMDMPEPDMGFERPIKQRKRRK